MALPRLLLVGCGKMGGAMLTGWLDGGQVGAVAVIEPATDTTAGFSGRGVRIEPSLDALVSGGEDFRPDVVVFAVKPQAMDAVVPPYRRFAAPGTVFLSIAAGKPVAYFADRLGGEAAIIRAMPNTPAAVGRGVTVLFANTCVTAAQKTVCEALLAAVGETAWIADEELMDAVTAVSGSGPAYVFLLIEALADAGVAAGLPVDLARQLARATVAGSGELARLAAEDPSQLRKNVTSPGGTTAAALDVLMAPDGLSALMARAVDAATRRSRELAV
jgi:pyrroline-5-carboxylate reductase